MNASEAPRVAAIQMGSGADVSANLAAAGRLLAAARAQGAKLAALPENFALMGAHEADKLGVAEVDGDGPIQQFLGDAARDLGLWIVGGTVPLKTRDVRRVAAACLVYDVRGVRVARYDKLHLFDVDVPGDATGRYRESASIAPGEGAPTVIDTPAGRLGLSVCYDLRFPELYRALGRQGAEILCVPAAFTARTGEAHWELLLRARAVENQCYVIAPAQHGAHPAGRRTWGHSLIAGPWGEILAEREQGEGVIVAALPREPLVNLRRSFPVLEHRRLT
ncbi:MAG TPA: carbon-nitrogen hydrolase family protein [Verrucomicrobiae bacterium]|nr:carbon-nitrogen hydrolase family protein [Verrucomicrobiae bacterium]